MSKTIPLITLGSPVAWKSQANGGYTTKSGHIVHVVKPGAMPNFAALAKKHGARSNYGGGSARDHESYVVLVPQGTTGKAKPLLYWPVVSGLRLVVEA